MASGGTVLGCYLSARLAANVACDIRNAVYDKSLELSASDFERFGTGSMITRSLNDINVIQQAVLQTIQLVLPVPFLAVAGIIFAWFIDPAMGTLLDDLDRACFAAPGAASQGVDWQRLAQSLCARETFAIAYVLRKLAWAHP